MDKKVNFMNLSISAPKKGEVSLGIKADIDIGLPGTIDDNPIVNLSKMRSNMPLPEDSTIGGGLGAGFGKSFETPIL